MSHIKIRSKQIERLNIAFSELAQEIELIKSGVDLFQHMDKAHRLITKIHLNPHVFPNAIGENLREQLKRLAVVLKHDYGVNVPDSLLPG